MTTENREYHTMEQAMPPLPEMPQFAESVNHDDIWPTNMIDAWLMLIAEEIAFHDRLQEANRPPQEKLAQMDLAPVKPEVVKKKLKPMLVWRGGKFRLAKKIIECIPAHVCYVEPFAGAAHVLYQKTPSPIEVLNDIECEVSNFWRVLRDHVEKLKYEHRWSFYSRHEFDQLKKMTAMELVTKPAWWRAWRFFYLNRCCMAGAMRWNMKQRPEANMHDDQGFAALLESLKHETDKAKVEAAIDEYRRKVEGTWNIESQCCACTIDPENTHEEPSELTHHSQYKYAKQSINVQPEETFRHIGEPPENTYNASTHTYCCAPSQIDSVTQYAYGKDRAMETRRNNMCSLSEDNKKVFDEITHTYREPSYLDNVTQYAYEKARKTTNRMDTMRRLSEDMANSRCHFGTQVLIDAANGAQKSRNASGEQQFDNSTCTWQQKEKCYTRSQTTRDAFTPASTRLSRAIIENLPWENCISRYDCETTFFYLDPPYVGTENEYGKGKFAPVDHERLADMLEKINGKFLLSINDCERAREIFGRFKLVRDWAHIYHDVAYHGPRSIHNATELLFANFDPDEIQEEPTHIIRANRKHNLWTQATHNPKEAA